MSFVNNSEFIWECLGNEDEWQDLGLTEQDELIFELISKDQLEIQKYKLRKDAELLNRIIHIDEAGNIFARKEYLPLVNKMKRRRRGMGEDSSNSSSDDGDSNCPGSATNMNELYEMPEFPSSEQRIQTPKK